MSRGRHETRLVLLLSGFFAIRADRQSQIVISATFQTQLGFTKFAIFEILERRATLTVFARKTSFQGVRHDSIGLFYLLRFPSFIFRGL